MLKQNGASYMKTCDSVKITGKGKYIVNFRILQYCHGGL